MLKIERVTSRDKILAAVAANQPPFSPLPEITFKGPENASPETFKKALQGIGGRVVAVASINEIQHFIQEEYAASGRIFSALPEVVFDAAPSEQSHLPNDLQDVELAIIKAHFGVAENGAVWITESLLTARVLPFICQHLAVVIHITDIVPTMHEAYQRIGNEAYDFGTFIAGPSKTADIEQSLVLGAHGPKSMTVFLLY